MTSWDDCDCKNTEGGKRAVIKGVGNVILIHCLSEACLESLPAASGEAALRGTQTVRGSSSRGMTAEDSQRLGSNPAGHPVGEDWVGIPRV